MLVYFAHPIDQVSGDLDQSDVAGLLMDASISLYRPGRAFHIAKDPLSDLSIVDKINRKAVAEADALVAWLPAGVPTLGVPSEIELALSLDKPTLILTDQLLWGRSVQLASWRDRGASVAVFDERQLGVWLANPQNLVDVLRNMPSLAAEETGTEYAVPQLLVRRNVPDAKVPSRAYRGDAGLDLATIEAASLASGEYRMLRTGVEAAVPDGWWGFMTGRSSTWSALRLEIKTAVIDSGYRGELMIGVLNPMSNGKVTISAGTRLAQYVLLPAFMGDVLEVDELPEHERGTNGYGSSGA